MFIRTPDGVYRSNLLLSQTWLLHGFASRHADAWPGEYTQVKQIHSTVVVAADSKAGVIGEADGIISRQPGQTVGIRTADCVPILIADPRTHAVGAVHAGWRGTVGRIAQATIASLQSEYGTTPAGLLVAIGPSIGSCCFEVGPEVAAQFDPKATCVDLVETNRRQLIEAGVNPDSIDVGGLCTKCNAHEFHSYRRDKEDSGRMVAAIRIREN